MLGKDASAASSESVEAWPSVDTKATRGCVGGNVRANVAASIVIAAMPSTSIAGVLSMPRTTTPSFLPSGAVSVNADPTFSECFLANESVTSTPLADSPRSVASEPSFQSYEYVFENAAGSTPSTVAPLPNARASRCSTAATPVTPSTLPTELMASGLKPDQPGFFSSAMTCDALTDELMRSVADVFRPWPRTPTKVTSATPII